MTLQKRINELELIIRDYEQIIDESITMSNEVKVILIRTNNLLKHLRKQLKENDSDK